MAGAQLLVAAVVRSQIELFNKYLQQASTTILGLYEPAKYLASSSNDFSKPKTQVAQVLASLDPSTSNGRDCHISHSYHIPLL